MRPQQTSDSLGDSAVRADELTSRIYEHVVLWGCASAETVAAQLAVPVAEVEAGLSRLSRLRLIRGGSPGGGFVAVSPSLAEMQLVVPRERAIQDEHRALAELRGQLRSFTDIFDGARVLQRPAVVVSADPEETWLRSVEAAGQCSSEVLAMYPVAAEDGSLPAELPDQQRLLDRGVRIRMIHQHIARTTPATRVLLNELTAKGVEVRTSRDVSERLLVFDREVGFVRHGDTDSAEPAASVVYDPSVVGLLCRIFEHTWNSAIVYEPNPAAAVDTMDEVKLTILELLASGLKDDVIARRLGMSPRTCRRHIAGLMDQLNATSRFQAGLAAVHCGLLTTTGLRP